MVAALILILLAASAAAFAQTEGAPATSWAHDALSHALTASRAIADPFRRAQALAEIAEAQISAGLDAEARENLATATSMALEVPDGALRAWAVHDVALAHVKAKDLEKAVSLADSIHDQELRDAVLTSVVDTYRSERDTARAIETARRIGDSARQGQALRIIAILQAADGDFTAALITARSIQHGPSNALALGDVAAALAGEGNVTEAQLLAVRIRPAEYRARALVQVAAAQAAAGDIQGALKATEQIDDRLEQAQALARVASVYAERRPSESRALFERAVTLARRARGRGIAPRRCDALIEIARAQIAANEYSGARATLQSALQQLSRLKTSEQAVRLSRIAPLQARAGDFPQAYATAMRAEDGSLRPLLVRDIAAIQAQRGETSAAVQLIRTLNNPLSSAAALFGVLRVQLQMGDAEGMRETLAIAIETVRQIVPPELRAGALASLAAAHVRAGELDVGRELFVEAMSSAERADPGAQQTSMYARIGDAVADRRSVAPD